jgi:hypothetical protein
MVEPYFEHENCNMMFLNQEQKPPRVGETLDIAGVLDENIRDDVESWFLTLITIT